MAAADIDRIITAYRNAIDAANYAEALVLDVELNSGTDYMMVWTNDYDGLYPLAEHQVEV